MLIAYPRVLLPLFDEAVSEVQTAILSIPSNEGEFRSLKSHCHARITGVSLRTFKNVSLPRSSDVGTLISISGTVIRTGSLKMMEKKKEVKCTKCKQQFSVEADLELDGNNFPKITKCQATFGDKPCPGKVFIDVEGGSEMTNYQEIKVQEQIQSLSMGSIPRSVIVILTDDLSDSCQAGDDVTVVGIVMRKWSWLAEGDRCNVNTFILANHIHVNNDREFNVHITEELTAEFNNFWQQFQHKPLLGRDNILRSVCPQVYGMYYVKLAFILVLIGGKAQHLASGLKIRGESHLLLVGEPGTGKSQFLKYAAKLGQRSVMTTGTGSTSAGLTVTAIKDKGGEWVLEAGALVLADGGVCCIDEFNCIKTADRATIHEAMEQQTLSVAKAGLVCKLNSRATVIAACNPKGGYDAEDDMSINLGIASPLLSRFDLVLILQDKKNESWDEQVSSFILNGINYEEESFWTLEQLKSYIAFVKASIAPSLTPEAQTIIQTYYTKQRMASNKNQAKTTIRLLESMVRLTEAHARLMFREEATVVDAIVTIVLMESSVFCTSLLDSVPSPLHSLLPMDPDKAYIEFERLVLRKLNLEHLSTENTNNSPDGFDSHSQNGGNNVPSSNNGKKNEFLHLEDIPVPHKSKKKPNVKSQNTQRANIWSIYSQKEPELQDLAGAQIAPDKNPINAVVAAGLQQRVSVQLEERRKEKEQQKQSKQTTINWEFADALGSSSDDDETMAFLQQQEANYLNKQKGNQSSSAVTSSKNLTGSKRTSTQATQNNQRKKSKIHDDDSADEIDENEFFASSPPVKKATLSAESKWASFYKNKKKK